MAGKETKGSQLGKVSFLCASSFAIVGGPSSSAADQESSKSLLLLAALLIWFLLTTLPGGGCHGVQMRAVHAELPQRQALPPAPHQQARERDVSRGSPGTLHAMVTAMAAMVAMCEVTGWRRRWVQKEELGASLVGARGIGAMF